MPKPSDFKQPSSTTSKIICTVTNDLTYDQRMIRICTSLVELGYEVTLVGRELSHSKPLQQKSFHQKRLRCYWNSGKLFYLEYNFRLFWWLLFQRCDGICSVDLDTILPGLLVCRLRGKIQAYDAHEYFTETPEVVRRPQVQRIWAAVARFCIPRIKYCYTVGDGLAQIFTQRYGVSFAVIRNVPFLSPPPPSRTIPEKPILFYQGALNEGRGLEQIITAMSDIQAELWLAGEGDLSQELRQLVVDLKLEDKVKFLGFVLPKSLPALTLQATIGLNLLENRGLSYYYSLANKAFDYIQATVPSINMAFPEYNALQEAHGTFVLIENLKKETLISAINGLLQNENKYRQIVENCKIAREVLNWKMEQERLKEFYNSIAFL